MAFAFPSAGRLPFGFENSPSSLCHRRNVSTVPKARPRCSRFLVQRPDMSLGDASAVTSSSRHTGVLGLRDTQTCRLQSEALSAGIKAVAVGKHGSRPIPLEEIPRIIDALVKIEQWEATEFATARDSEGRSTRVDDENILDLLLQRASFLGALFVKTELSGPEMSVLSRCLLAKAPPSGRSRTVDGISVSANDVLAYACGGPLQDAKTSGTAPGAGSEATSQSHEAGLGPLCSFALALLNGDSLSREQAEDLGVLLYDCGNNFGVAILVKALIAHVMRIRHESSDELIGLTRAAGTKVTAPQSTVGGSDGPLFAHLAEPFDGTSTWDLLTPLIARHLRLKHGLGVVMGTGVSSGPKFGPNLRDVVLKLNVPFANSVSEARDLACNSQYGVAVDQADVAPGVSAWVRIRRAILKRPALATVEKYVDILPNRASLFIASAFHTSYVDKMASVAEAVGYPAYVIVSKGVEGCIGVGGDGRRSASFLVGVKVPGTESYKRHELVAPRVSVESGAETGNEAAEDHVPLKGSASATRTAAFTEQYVQRGTSGNACFDARVLATLKTFDSALELIMPSLQLGDGPTVGSR